MFGDFIIILPPLFAIRWPNSVNSADSCARVLKLINGIQRQKKKNVGEKQRDESVSSR